MKVLLLLGLLSMSTELFSQSGTGNLLELFSFEDVQFSGRLGDDLDTTGIKFIGKDNFGLITDDFHLQIDSEGGYEISKFRFTVGKQLNYAEHQIDASTTIEELQEIFPTAQKWGSETAQIRLYQPYKEAVMPSYLVFCWNDGILTEFRLHVGCQN